MHNLPPREGKIPVFVLVDSLSILIDGIPLQSRVVDPPTGDSNFHIFHEVNIGLIFIVCLILVLIHVFLHALHCVVAGCSGGSARWSIPVWDDCC